jgi:hypothetical protein
VSFVSFFATPMSQTDDRAHHWGMSPIHSQSPHLLQVVTHTPILHPLTPSCPTPSHYLHSCMPHACLMSVHSLCCLVASDPLSLSPLELERCISACPSVPPSVHSSPHAHYYIVSWHMTTNTCGHRHEYQVFFAMSHLFTQPKEPQRTSTMSASSFSFQQHTGCNDIYTTPNVSLTSSSSRDLSVSSGSFISGPSTLVDISLRSPAHISNLGDYLSGTSGGPSVLDSSTYNQLMHHCRHLESELTKERQEHVTLKYVIVTCLCSRIH